MKKTVMALAVLAMMAFAPVASAQKSEDSNNKAKTEYVKKEGKSKKCDKSCDKDSKDCKKGDSKQFKGEFKKSKGCQNGNCAFENLNLTDEQKTKLQDLNTRVRSEKEVARAEMKENRAKNDSLKKVARLEKKRGYLNEVKTILTADQYVQFLENSFVNNNGQQSPKKALKGGKQYRDGSAKGIKAPQMGKKIEKNVDKTVKSK